MTTEDLRKLRSECQAEAWKYSLEQKSTKTSLVSVYGALGSAYFRFFDIRHAEAITMTGQLIIRHVADQLNKFLSSEFGARDYVLGSDTDSVILSIDSVVKNLSIPTSECVDVIDDYCENKLQPIINKAFADIHSKLNTIEPILAMKREAIAEHGVWTAKKRYILWMHDNEGVRYDPPRLKIVGIEAVRSSTPKYARAVIKQALEYFVKSDLNAFYDLIDEAEDNYDKKPFAEIASPRSVNGLLEYPILADGSFSNKTPIHVKGALVYNREIMKSGLTSKYELIVSGQKIRFCYLKAQNPFRSNVIAAPNTLPAEWKLERYLDRSTQFEKTVLQPIQTIIQHTGWTIRRISSLDF